MVGGSDFNISRGGQEMLRITGLDHLPDDILMQILTRIPAQDIVDSTKFVCRKWREVTGTRDFAYAHVHLHRSTPGLVFQRCNRLKPSTFMSLARAEGNYQVQISDFIYRSRYGYFWTGCNGLILEPKVNDGRELMITNPVTRHRFDLPPFFARPTIHHSFSSAIAHVGGTTRNNELYKVVRVYHPDPYHDKNRLNCAILTVGVDNSWRLVDTQHLSSLAASGKLIQYCPLVTEGFVHWGQESGSYNNNNHILSLNMETEIITQILAPQCNNGRYTYLPAGSSLSLLIEVGRLKWEVWEMKPLESGEWKKLPNIDLLKELFRSKEEIINEDADCLDCCHLSPSGWLKFPEVIAFLASKLSMGCRILLQNVVYNVETKDVSLYKLDDCYRPILVHTNSLVRILS